MRQITSYHQVQELKVGSIVIQKALESLARFSVLSCTPIGWEDIEFELSLVDTINGSAAKNVVAGDLNILGSEFISEHFWWIPL